MMLTCIFRMAHMVHMKLFGRLSFQPIRGRDHRVKARDRSNR